MDFLLPFEQLVFLDFEVLLELGDLAVESLLRLTEVDRVFLDVFDLGFNVSLLHLKIAFSPGDNKLTLLNI